MRQAASTAADGAARGRLPRSERAAVAAALLYLGALGCGARTDPPEEGNEDFVEAFGGAGPVDPSGPCVACDGSVICSHCYIQGYDVTYRCRPTQAAPSPSCMGLGESHVDQFGAAYTCFYCS